MVKSVTLFLIGTFWGAFSLLMILSAEPKHQFWVAVIFCNLSMMVVWLITSFKEDTSRETR